MLKYLPYIPRQPYKQKKYYDVNLERLGLVSNLKKQQIQYVPNQIVKIFETNCFAIFDY